MSTKHMSRVEDVDRYLRAYFAAQRMPERPTTDERVRPFVTISREAGTGAHALGDTMLDVFSRQPDTELFGGWQVFDRTVCDIVVQDGRFAKSLDSLIEEEYRSKTNDFFHQMMRSTVDQSMVMKRVFLVVRTVASMGKAIIVGRAGSHVTKDMPRGVSIRLVGDEELRVARAMDANAISMKEARARGRRRDSARARLLRQHFASDIDDLTGYDAVFNVGRATHEEIASSVACLVRTRVQGDDG